MCGIAGVLRYPADAGTRRSLVRRMGAAIRHRGPDDQGEYVDADIAIGMQRLSIIDIEGGHQPMASGDGLVQIVFNGEIFNFRDLRAILRREGETFHTESDTEVILRQYERHGLDGFNALNGMFAVALWDARARELHLVRDRMGVKPLYYYWDGNLFAFASEIKALLELPLVERAIEPRAIWDYLTFRYVPGPATIWRHISKLQPGHRLTMAAAGGGPKVARWWDIPRPQHLEQMDDAAMTEQFGALFSDAVNRRMVADVPVGIMLSGGIDSSAVAAVAVKSHGRNLKTFSVSFRDSPATDERAYARQVAGHLGTDHSEIEIGAREFLDFLPDFVRFSDEPLADLASVPLYYVSKLARETVKVALSGEGADEILAGYDFDRWVAGRAAVQPPLDDVRADLIPPHMTNYMDSAAKRALMRGDAPVPDSLDVLRGHLARAGSQHPLNQMLYLYCQDWLVEDLLMKADRMSMANSLELRTPFLDYRLVEWAARAPITAKVGSDADGKSQTKRVLRQFAAPLLPREILTRPKQGFPVPVYGWLSGELKPVADDLLCGPSARLSAWFRPEGVRALVDRGTAPDAAMPDRHRLWNLMILEYWFRAWAH
jgi:asparagine synthase (glutamine-hydrolysing)